MYLLDTNIMSDLVRHPQGVVAQRIASLNAAHLATSIIVAGELRYGAEKRGSERLTNQLEGILQRLAILPLAEDADRHYSVLRADLERRGEPIGANDMLIAAHALSIAAILVTDNLREFSRVQGLKLENWLRGE
jgi:tRNA(fMet)-specific endonuclease VapC